jgi:hypothetical protein
MRVQVGESCSVDTAAIARSLERKASLYRRRDISCQPAFTSIAVA